MVYSKGQGIKGVHQEISQWYTIKGKQWGLVRKKAIDTTGRRYWI